MRSHRTIVTTFLAGAIAVAGCGATASTGSTTSGTTTTTAVGDTGSTASAPATTGTSTTPTTASAASVTAGTLAATHEDAADLEWDAAAEVAITLADGAGVTGLRLPSGGWAPSLASSG